MNLRFYLEKLHSSESFQKFIKENPDAFPCSCFFVIDKEGNDNKQHIDYYVSSEKKMFSFQLENMSSAPKGVHQGGASSSSSPSVKGDINTEGIPVEQVGDDPKKGQVVFEKISDNIDFDFKDIEKIIFDKMNEQGIKNKIQKILLSLQNKDSKDFLIGTVFISNLGMLKVNIDISKMKIILFEKKSFFDFIRK